jgi:hypothetical protein
VAELDENDRRGNAADQSEQDPEAAVRQREENHGERKDGAYRRDRPLP